MNTRRRTGCLTCRARHIKCDEAKPTCERCESSNVECLGYERKRQISLRQSRSQPTRQNVKTSLETDTQNVPDVPYLKIRADGLPLMGLPSNPLPSQRPHAAARHILAYHQYVFRTLTVLFPTEHFYFWKDHLCQRAWEKQCVYNAIIALGTMHRAALLMATNSKSDRNRGVDTKVIAVQAYTTALQVLSDHFDHAESSIVTLIGVVLLLAYFECFAGNVPAAYRFVRVASHYYESLVSNESDQNNDFFAPIECCLRNLARLCRTILPVPALNISIHHFRAPTPKIALRETFSTPSTAVISCSTMLSELYDLASASSEIEDLVWTSLMVVRRTASLDMIYAFQEDLAKWVLSRGDHLPRFESAQNSLALLESGSIVIDDLCMPPKTHSVTSSQICLVAALYEFLMARATWALSFVGEETKRQELLSYIYCHRAMEWIATAVASHDLEGMGNREDLRLPCETFDNGLLPMLYLMGQTSPRLDWLQWTVELLNKIEQEGLFSGKALAKSLGALTLFEQCNSMVSSTNLNHFPSSRARVIAILLPESNGRSFTTYYAGPRSDADQDSGNQHRYYPLGTARWSTYAEHDLEKPDIEFYSRERKLVSPFTDQWLLNQKVAHEWISWAGGAQFDLDRVVTDHINGSRLILAAENTQT